MEQARLLIVGLGNPGQQYIDTRHNLGVAWITALCHKYQIALQINHKLHAMLGCLDKNIICMLSTDYMNLSGIAVNLVAKYYKLAIENILIVHDELDLLPGIIKFKFSGGHAGHNGVKNIMQALNSRQFKRLRIGIGHPMLKTQVVDYVLNHPSTEDQMLINRAINHSLNIVPAIAKFDWSAVVQLLHEINTK